MSKRLTTEQFIEDILCSEVHPDGKYNYRMVDYTNNHSKIEIFCNHCNRSFKQEPNNHKKGNGCPECLAKRYSKDYSHTTERFIEDILCSKVHPDGKYNYRMVEYSRRCDKIEIFCNYCKKYFWQIAGNHKQGSGCRRCYKKMYNIRYIKENLTIEEDAIEIDDIILCRCSFCKEYFIPNKKQIQNRLGGLLGKARGDNRLYCSDKCKNNCPIYKRVVHYKDNNITKHDTTRPDQPGLRKIVFERDNNQCQRCGSSDDLHCHHITGVEINPVESADIDNCITLCYTCHSRVHNSGQCYTKRKPCNV